MAYNYKHLAEVVTVGDSGCGRSALLFRVNNPDFPLYTHSTIGIEFLTNTDANDLTLRIWDTAGHEAYREIIKSYYKSKQAFVIAFDCTNRESFKNIENWLTHIKENAPLGEALCYPIILLMTKAELICALPEAEIKRKHFVTFKEALKKSDELNLAMVCETSAREGVNVNALLAGLRFIYFSPEYQPDQLYAYSYDNPDIRRYYQRNTLHEVQGCYREDFEKGLITRLKPQPSPPTLRLMIPPTLESEPRPSSWNLGQSFRRMFNSSTRPPNVAATQNQTRSKRGTRQKCSQCGCEIVVAVQHGGLQGFVCQKCFSQRTAIN